MNAPIVICDHGFLEASLVPARLLDAPGNCPRGAYDTILWEGGRFVNLQDHLDRFTQDCRYLDLEDVQRDEGYWRNIIHELVRANELEAARSRVRLMAFHEPQNGGISLPDAITFMAAAWPAPAPVETKRISCLVSHYTRPANDESYQHKLLGCHEVIADLEKAAKEDCQDVIYFNDRGEACEAAYSNLWLIKDDVVYTAPVSSPCLPGIVRKRLLDQSVDLGVKMVCDKPITRDVLKEANAVFLTSSIRGIQPVENIKGLWQEQDDSPEMCEIIPRLVTSLNLC